MLETDLDGATLSFEWLFAVVSVSRAKLTQRIVLSGDDTAKHVAAVRDAFGPNLAAGMERIAAAIAAAPLLR